LHLLMYHKQSSTTLDNIVYAYLQHLDESR
jgi:hypothetical protein